MQVNAELRFAAKRMDKYFGRLKYEKTKTTANIAFGNMVAWVSNNEHRVRYWAFVSA